MMDLKEMMKMEKDAIEGEIVQFFQEEKANSLQDPFVIDILGRLEEYTLRDAKRVRSILMVIGYCAVGGKDVRKVRRAAISLELIQTMLLVHDDIIDRSHKRRGAPSFHKVYEEVHLTKEYLGDPEHFGQNMAIIAGDLAESLGERALLRSGFPKENLLDALLCQTEMIRDTGYGQIFDLYSVELPEWTEEDVLKVHTYKTARYTLDSPLRIGALLHGASEKQLSALEGYALKVGVPFQIIDDFTGYLGNHKRRGKEALSDITEGKRTLLIIKALENCDPEQKNIINSALGDTDLKLGQAEKVREIIRETGSEDHSRNVARSRTKEGLTALRNSDLDPKMIEFLRLFADHLVNRG